MRYSTATAAAAMVVALNLGEVLATPTHAHLHRAIHEKKDVDWDALDWDKMGINWSSAYAAGQASKAAAVSAAPTTTTTTTTTAAPTTTATSASTTSKAAAPATSTTALTSALPTATKAAVKSDNIIADLWHDLVGFSNARTSFGGQSAASGSAGDNYVGNCGVPYGSNIIKVASREGYPYTNEFINTSGESMTIVVWNKIGSDGQVLSGSALAPKNAALTFALAPGQSQIVAFDENSQVGWAQATDQLAASGAFATTWGEANFNGGGSGYDVSAIMNPNGSNYDMTISSTEASCISSMTENYWLTDTQPIGNSDGSCFIAQSSTTLTTKMGGTV
ncbi:hypothetical protein B7463_g12144, partial [Scytalidium lignicola]